MRFTSILFASLLASSLVACATDPGDESTDAAPRTDPILHRGIDITPSGVMTASSYLAGMHAALCDVAYACQTAFPATTTQSFSDGWSESKQDCYSAPQPDDPQVVDERVRIGALRFDSAAARACLSHIEIHSCEAFWAGAADVPSTCDSVLVGTAREGERCVLGLECADAGSFCDNGTHICTRLTRK